MNRRPPAERLRLRNSDRTNANNGEANTTHARSLSLPVTQASGHSDFEQRIVQQQHNERRNGDRVSQRRRAMAAEAMAIAGHHIHTTASIRTCGVTSSRERGAAPSPGIRNFVQ